MPFVNSELQEADQEGKARRVWTIDLPDGKRRMRLLEVDPQTNSRVLEVGSSSPDNPFGLGNIESSLAIDPDDRRMLAILLREAR